MLDLVLEKQSATPRLVKQEELDMRKSLAAAVAFTSVGAAAWLAVPATAATSCTASGSPLTCSQQTTASITIDPGTLSMSVASAGTTVPLTSSGTVLAGGSVSGDLGNTTVTDTRGSSTGWSVAVAATDFTHGSDTIPISNASWSAGGIGGVSLPSTCGTAGLLTFPAVTQLSTSATTVATCALPAGSLLPSLGTSTGQWDNTMSVRIPANTPAGTYTSTVTQSVQ